MVSNSKNERFHQFIKKNINEYVELDSYLSSGKLYGVISHCDRVALTLTRSHINYNNPRKNEKEVLYIPINSIKSIRKL